MTPSTSPVSQIADASAREQALDIIQSVCVQAPAGSGKTELLTQRIMKLLAVCEQPENILAITFTRKAAAEMRNRLLETLDKAAAINDADFDELEPHAKHSISLGRAVLERDRQQAWLLRQNPSRLQITTIDSFNGTLATRLPLLSGFGSQPDINDQADRLYQEAVLELFRKLEAGTALSDDLATVLAHFGNNLNQIQELLCSLLAKRDQWLTYIVQFQHDNNVEGLKNYLETHMRSIIESSLDHAHDLVGHELPELVELLRYARASLIAEAKEKPHVLSTDAMTFIEAASIPSSVCDDLPIWKALCLLLLTGEGNLRSSRGVTKTIGFPAGDNAAEKKENKPFNDSFKAILDQFAENPDVAMTLQQVSSLPDPAFQNEQWQVLLSLTRVLYQLTGELAVVFQRHNQCDYTQVSLAALQALGEEDNPTALALRLDYRIQHILVDEFQDTSRLQKDLLEKLTRGWQPNDGRTLFIVGDPMQSCYGFRNANVGLFLNVRDNGLGQLKPADVRLRVNFRSEVPVVEWVNNIFNLSLPQEDDPSRGAVSYNMAQGIKVKQADAGVELLLLTPDEETRGNQALMDETEASKVIELVQQIQTENPESTIAILVKNRPHLKCILPALRSAGIRWNANDIDPLGAYPDLGDLLTLCRALLNPADSTAWLALLRTPFIGLRMTDIHTLVLFAKQETRTLYETLNDFSACSDLNNEALTILTRVVPLLDHARSQRQKRALRDWLEHTWTALGGPACISDEIDTTHLEAFFSLLEKESSAADILDMQLFQETLNRTYVNSKPDATVNLQIMTIHKAKGLEFDHVILPHLHGTGASDKSQALRWQETLDENNNTNLLVSLPARKGDDKDSLHTYLGKEATERSRLEDARVLYIGVTRARTKAWLIGGLSRDNKGKLSCPDSSLLGRIWDAIQPYPENSTEVPVVNTVGRDGSSSQSPEPQLLTRRLPVQWKTPLAVTTPAAENSDDTTEQFTLPNPLERLRGDIMHDCLRQAAEGTLQLQNAEALNTLGQLWNNRFSMLTDVPESVVADLQHQLQNLANSNTANWILNHFHAEAACEYSLSDYRGRWRKESIIDRTFVENGIRWIIDYKSSTPASGQTQNEFLVHESERYAGQLNRYADLFRQLEPNNTVKTALYFTALDLLHIIAMQPA